MPARTVGSEWPPTDPVLLRGSLLALPLLDLGHSSPHYDPRRCILRRNLDEHFVFNFITFVLLEFYFNSIFFFRFVHIYLIFNCYL